jgi:UDP-N-acetylmuramate dehydrogenase
MSVTLEQVQAALGPTVRGNEPIAKYTTFKLGGPAEFFFEAKSADDAAKAVAAAKQLGIPCFVFGGGSNMLVADGGVKGLVVKMTNRGLRIEGIDVIADAGAPSGLVSMRATDAGLTGLEWMVGLPGTIGGAVRGNAGMFGGEVKDSLVSARVLRDGEDLTLTNAECQFAYRDSIIKEHRGQFVVLSATFRLAPSPDREAGKALLKSYLLEKKAKQPIEWPCAGCIFTNWRPESPEVLGEVRKYFDLGAGDEIPMTTQGTVPAGWIIDRAGLKGTTVGHVTISEKHGNFMVQDGKGTTDEVIQMIAMVKTRVRNSTHGLVQLQEEVELVGF